MLTVRLSPDIERRLNALARRAGRAKSHLVREAIERYLEDLEDEHLANHRLARQSERISLEVLESELLKDKP
jgi:RHH-type transcriptional regulator, rel operon repressor / antitoxin RelB